MIDTPNTHLTSPPNTAGRGVFMVPGLKEMHALGVNCYVGKGDVEFTQKQTTEMDIVEIKDGDEIIPGVKILHTPGHTPGSICVYMEPLQALITGDTLFIGSCGRVDLQESDPQAMDHSLARLALLPVDTKVYPGHNYAAVPVSTIGRERTSNLMMRQAMLSVLKMNETSGRDSGRLVHSTLPAYLQAAKQALIECEKETEASNHASPHQHD